MSKNSFVAKLLRYAGIVLMGLTAGFTLLGGIGTTCVALNPTGFSANMAKLAPFQWLYILFVLLGVALGILGIRATIHLVKGTEKSYQEALIVLVAGTLVGAIHVIVSRALRGSSMPVDGVLYATVLTLILFLLFRIPYIWQGVNFAKGDVNSNRMAGGAAAILLGGLSLSVQYLVAATHTWNGVNYADAFHATLTGFGLVCLLIGAGLMLWRPAPAHAPLSERSVIQE